ncbi:MAG: hypothetical protein ACYS18_07365 [Planctomycetota bacterium]|jgi:hypothetical protein
MKLKMLSKITILILTLCLSAAAAEPSPLKYLLRDGFALAGIDGKLTEKTSGGVPGKWFFELQSDLNDDISTVGAGEKLQILPSKALEKIEKNIEERSTSDYRLWGKATKYNGENFIFPTYFLPLSKLKSTEPLDPAPAPQETAAQKPKAPSPQIKVNEPNDPLPIPQEIIEKLRNRPVLSAKTLTENKTTENNFSPPPQMPQLKQDYILVDRTAFLQKDQNGSPVFILDALGRNLPKLSFKLLPSQALEIAQQKQTRTLEPQRFKIAGIITEYNGQLYLLPQKATRVHSHGNFGK